MTARVNHIAFDSAEPYELAAFWAQVTGFRADPDDEPGDPEASLENPDSGLALLFIAVPESKAGKNRIHLDLQPTDHGRDAEVERLLGLGATMVADHRRDDGTGWVTLADPEGNEFCVERNAEERQQTAVKRPQGAG